MGTTVHFFTIYLYLKVLVAYDGDAKCRQDDTVDVTTDEDANFRYVPTFREAVRDANSRTGS